MFIQKCDVVKNSIQYNYFIINHSLKTDNECVMNWTCKLDHCNLCFINVS